MTTAGLAELEITRIWRQETSSGSQGAFLTFLFCFADFVLFCCFFVLFCFCLNPKGSHCLFCLHGFTAGFLTAVLYVEKGLWDTLWSPLLLQLLNAMLQDFDPIVLYLSFNTSTKANPSSALSSEICRSCFDVLKLSCLQLLSFKAANFCSSQPDGLPAAIPSLLQRLRACPLRVS